MSLQCSSHSTLQALCQCHSPGPLWTGNGPTHWVLHVLSREWEWQFTTLLQSQCSFIIIPPLATFFLRGLQVQCDNVKLGWEGHIHCHLLPHWSHLGVHCAEISPLLTPFISSACLCAGMLMAFHPDLQHRQEWTFLLLYFQLPSISVRSHHTQACVGAVLTHTGTLLISFVHGHDILLPLSSQPLSNFDFREL